MAKYNVWADVLGQAWIPTRVPKSSLFISVLLVLCSCITSTTFGYDQSMINGLNILPSYSNYFHLNVATTGLNTATVYVGGFLAGLTYGKVTDIIGRRPALLWAAVLTLIAVLLQTAAQNIGMFVFARILIGYGTSASGLSGPAYLAETLPYQWRGWGLGIFNDFYYVGGLIAAGVTYGTAPLNSTWAWRTPSLIQGVFSLMCIAILPFIPESPRWLAYQGDYAAALRVVAQTYAGGDESDPLVQAQFKEILDVIEWECGEGEQVRMSYGEMVRSASARNRVGLAVSAAVFSTIAGNVIASYYLGTMLDNAGISNTTTQLQINIILNAFCLVCSLIGTYYADRWGRKPITLASQASLTVFLFMVGALTKVYGSSENTSGVYGTVACIFLFQGAYSFGWTPILYLYPPEVLNYPIRANGMGVFQIFLNGAALLMLFTMPLALTKLGWKTYMINGAWDVVTTVIIAYWWVETKGKTLEEVDAALDGEKHSAAPDLEAVRRGEVGVGKNGEMEKPESAGYDEKD